MRKACQWLPGLDLLEMAGYLGLWDSLDGLGNRIKAGMLVSRLFNSPFQFETAERRIAVKSAYEVGYLFFAPVISDFVLWFRNQVRHSHVRNVWFCARDGYLIKKMYDELAGEDPSVYFLTSRTAAIRAGMEKEEDIRYVEEMKFSGTLREQLRERFGITLPRHGTEAAGGTLLDYSREILDRARICRRNYRSYIDMLDIREGDIAFFDFVAKGTSQMYIGRLVGNHLKGLYFLQLEKEHMQGSGLDIASFFQSEGTADNAVFNDYYILETVLTSPMPSIDGFDGHGTPCYAEETRREEDLVCIQRIQKGIMDYFRDYLKLVQNPETDGGRELDGLLLSLVHSISIQSHDFLSLKVEDPFFNRVTDVADLI